MIADDGHGLLIEVKGTAHAVGDVPQVHANGRRGALFDFRIQVAPLAAANRVNEVQEVIAAQA